MNLGARPTLVVVPASATPALPDDTDLIASLREGDLDALAQSFDRYHARLRTLARRLLWDDASAEDVVQEVFTVLPRAIRRFRGEVTLENFLMAIAVKRSRHHQRSAGRRRRAMDRLAGTEIAVATDPEHQAYRRQLGNRLAKALSSLPHAQSEAFVLCVVEELTSVQAALVADAPEATMRTRVFHARRRLRALLSDEHAE